jgi:hypothetical protein
MLILLFTVHIIENYKASKWREKALKCLPTTSLVKNLFKASQ